MAISSVVTEGFGPGASIALVVTSGFVSSDVVVVTPPDLTAALRLLIAESTCALQLATYLGDPAVFSRVPVPAAADYPMVVITTASVQEEDAVRDFRPTLSYNIAVSGLNNEAAQYRVVSQVAYCIRALLHRQKNVVIDEWTTVDQRCIGPVDQPSAGSISTRVVTLIARIAQRVS